MTDLTIRSVNDDDASGLIALIEGVFAEYPDCVLDVDADMPELRQPATDSRRNKGCWWVAECDGRVVGSVALVADDDTIELKRLYVNASARRRGLGAHLVKLVECEAAQRDAARIVLWTDTRFLDAHRLYERLGYRREPGMRALNDVSNSIEYRYIKELG